MKYETSMKDLKDTFWKKIYYFDYITNQKKFFFFLRKMEWKESSGIIIIIFFIKNNSNRISKCGNMHIDTPTQRGMHLFADNSD